MANENLTKKSFSFPSCSFDDGAVCAKIEFGRADNVELATICADGKIIGVCALNSIGARDVAYCPIDRTEGTYDVTVTVENHAVIYDISFLKTPAYAQQPYEPIPEESIRPIDSDTWEAVDMLGRPVASVEDVGPKSDRKVGNGTYGFLVRTTRKHRNNYNY